MMIFFIIIKINFIIQVFNNFIIINYIIINFKNNIFYIDINYKNELFLIYF